MLSSRRSGWIWLLLAGGVPAVGVATVILVVLLILVVFLGGIFTPPATGTGTSGNVVADVALWWPAVQAAVKASGAGPTVNTELLALMAHESGGNPHAMGRDSNNTVDAGLLQINSGVLPAARGWATQGLMPWPKPLNPWLNTVAGARHFAGNLRSYPGHESAALYAYNGGTAANGRRYDPTYAPDVLNYQAEFAKTRILAWPAGAPPNTASHYQVKGRQGALELAVWAPDPRSTTPYDGVAPLVRPTSVTVNGQPALWVATPDAAAAQGITLASGQGVWVGHWPATPAGASVTLAIRAQWASGATATRVITLTTCPASHPHCVPAGSTGAAVPSAPRAPSSKKAAPSPKQSPPPAAPPHRGYDRVSL